MTITATYDAAKLAAITAKKLTMTDEQKEEIEKEE